MPQENNKNTICFPYYGKKKETDESIFLLFPVIFYSYLCYSLSIPSRAITSIRRQNVIHAFTVKLFSTAILS